MGGEGWAGLSRFVSRIIRSASANFAIELRHRPRFAGD